MAKLKVYFFPTQDTGCGKYRSWSPAASLERTGLCEIRRGPDQPEEVTIERTMEIFDWADIVYTQAFTALWASTFFVATRDRMKKKLIVDLDDSVWDIHPMNVGSLNGKPFLLNDHFSDDPNKFWDVYQMTDEQWKKYIDEMHPDDKGKLDKPTFLHGTMLEMDGRKVFVKQKNADARSACTFYTGHADAVTTTTPHLANRIRTQSGQNNIYCLPNCLNPIEWEGTPATHSSNELWLGWSGSVSHYPDLKLLMEPLDRLMKRYPHLRIHIMGSCFDYLFPPHDPSKGVGVYGYAGGQSPAAYFDYKDCGERWPGRMKFDRPVPIQQYPAWMRSNWIADIAMAPLDNFAFNNFKSELKWCEYAILGVPTVASKFGPYVSTIRHGVDGLLAGTPRAWELALEELIESPERRSQFAHAARERVLDEYNADRQAYRWLDVFERVMSAEPRPLPDHAQAGAHLHAV